jgi:S-adenosylmethionine:tRNA ribosyltransferase-isomerase
MSKLLVYSGNRIRSDIFRSISGYIPAESLLVFNNTRVIRARLIFYKDSGARIEVFCLEPLSPSDYSLSFSSKQPVEWKCLIGNLKKWKDDLLETVFIRGNKRSTLKAKRLSMEGDGWRIRFSWDAEDITFGDVIEYAGHIPLPPYITREDETKDGLTYQTIYSLVKGSVASPTAGLHFTREVFDSLDLKGINRTELTLHVGAGTFQPVKSKRISEHIMHTEHFFIDRKSLESVLMNIGKIIAVGTTSVRTLESLYWIGVKVADNPLANASELFTDQWEPYERNNEIRPGPALEYLLDWMIRNEVEILHAPTRIIIVPGYKFRIIDGMVTNFHQPGSTLLLLISAWTGESWRKIYDFALGNNFRYLSYGDSSLLLK